MIFWTTRCSLEWHYDISRCWDTQITILDLFWKHKTVTQMLIKLYASMNVRFLFWNRVAISFSLKNLKNSSSIVENGLTMVCFQMVDVMTCISLCFYHWSDGPGFIYDSYYCVFLLCGWKTVVLLEVNYCPLEGICASLESA